MNWKIILPVAIILVLSAAVASGIKLPSEKRPVPSKASAGPYLVVSPKEFDFGKVLQSGGVVSADFSVTNYGGAEAVIGEVFTSCSCTTARIDKNSLKSGETAKLTVMFDPNYHFEDEGRFFRTATIKSNAPGPAPEVKIYVEVDYDLGKDKLKFPPKIEEEEHKD